MVRLACVIDDELGLEGHLRNQTGEPLMLGLVERGVHFVRGCRRGWAGT